jgi:IS1 family transposase
MRTTTKDAAAVLTLLLEGLSIRSASRITGMKRNTIHKLILVVGANCERLLRERVKNVQVSLCEADEIWSFVRMKERQRHAGNFTGDEGHSWTFVAMDSDSKMILAHEVGQRDNQTCCRFLDKLNAATVGRFQLSTDGLGAYTLNVPFVFRGWVDFGQLIKSFQAVKSIGRYSPPRITKAEKRPMYGNPDVNKICTSHIERFNLTLRMQVRRFTRLTNAHSKSLKHHVAMQAIFVAFYNFTRRHEALGKRTPAMAAGLTDKPWSLRDLIEAAANP